MSNVITFDENGLPFAEAFGDHYYSRNDGRAECAHVFLAGNGLPDRWHGAEVFTIGELGFGTGLNFLETWSQWRAVRNPGQVLKFVTLEGFPLERDTAEKALSRWPDLNDLAQQLLAIWPRTSADIAMDEQTQLDVRIGSADQQLPHFPKIDAWFLDGFAPAKNPDMWSAGLMDTLGERTNAGGTCASYTAAGWVRRNLTDAGFLIEKRPGFGTKRDMIAGTKI